jgi:hypothetical protein
MSELDPNRHDLSGIKTELRTGEPFRRVVKDPNPLTRVLTKEELFGAAYRMYTQDYKDSAQPQEIFETIDFSDIRIRYTDCARIAAQTWGLKFND